MRIQHNIAALNAHRYLSQNNDAVAKNLEKLSSGYKINRAGDDAAGLSISEKMRAQITGLETAKKNAQDGVSLVQTAEGNLTEVHSMLNRMVELSTQAANGTYQDLNRTEIQKEITSLTSEIDRISSSANFNGIKLLDGSLEGGAHVTKAVINNAEVKPAHVDAAKADFTSGAISKATDTTTERTLTIKYHDAANTEQTLSVTYKGGANADQTRTNIMNKINGDGAMKALFTAEASGGDQIKLVAVNASSAVTSIDEMSSTDAGKIDAGTKGTVGADEHDEINLKNWGATSSITINGKTYTGAATRTDLTTALQQDGIVLGGTEEHTTFTMAPDAKVGLMLQIGESNDDYQQVRVSVGKMDSKSLGLADLDLTSQNGALEAIDVVTRAIDTVSGTRGTLGAIQNRLEHTINNLSVTDENMTAAESRIRDVDMAKEMMDFTKNNILTQAAQSMLAQANTLPQGVLQLLR